MDSVLDYAALYPRVSTDRQKDNWSVKDQLALASLAAPLGLPVVLYDGDLGISGETIEARPDMTVLLYDLEHGQISKSTDTEGRPITGGRLKAIICVDLNRLSRDQDVIDGLRIKKACKDAGARILTPGKVYDFTNETDELLAGFELLISGNQKQKIVKAVSRGIYKKAHDGAWPGGVVPYGYRAVFDVPHPDGRFRGRLVVVPEHAEVVRRIYTLYVSGHTRPDGTWEPMTLGGVCRVVNGAGHRLPARHRRDPGQQGEPRPFEVKDVGRILESRVYAGYRAWGGGRKAQKKNNPYVKDLGAAEVFDPEMRVVDADLWLRAAEKRSASAHGPRRNNAPTKALQGLLRCPRCGGHMAVHHSSLRDGTRIQLYDCLPFRRFGRVDGRGCPEGGFCVTDEYARLAVEDALARLFASVNLDGMLDAQVRRAREASQDGQRAGVEAALADVRLQLKNLVDAVAKGELKPGDIREKRAELDASEHRHRTRLAGLEAQAGATDEALALAEGLQRMRGEVPAYVASLGARDPARYRQFLGWFFAGAVIDGDGHGRGRRVWLRDVLPTEAGAAFFGMAAGAWLSPEALMAAPLMRNAHEWSVPPALGWLLPAPPAVA